MSALDPDLVSAIAIELAVDPSFVEKDWHAMRLVAAIAGLEHGGMRPVFAGGTSLSKAFGLIKRFSEDLDFRMALPEADVGRGERRAYRKLAIETIRANEDWTIEDDDVQSRNQSQFFSCLVRYAENFALSSALRPYIKLEMTFLSPAVQAKEGSVSSFVSQARNDPPEAEGILCIDPVETAADKLSALTWRVLSRQRDSENDDPTLIRHLHDLAALEAIAASDPIFPELLKATFSQDVDRGGVSSGRDDMTAREQFSAALNSIVGDSEYRREYEQFVVAMSYAAEDETPSFDEALQAIRRLGDQIP